MFGQTTDRDWETLGKQDPCWAVLTKNAFRGTGDERLEDFLKSGRTHVKRLWEVIETTFVEKFRPDRALDFGCGVGRVAIPMADRCRLVVGVDVAQSMLDKAHSLCTQLRVSNVELAKADDSLAAVPGGFDFVHSYIVFQHIPPGRGLALIQRLIGKLNPNGIGALHVIYHNPDMAFLPTRLLKIAWRRLKRPFLRSPQMQMNAYPLNEVFRIIQLAGAGRIHALTTNHGGCLGAVLFFRKASGETLF